MPRPKVNYGTLTIYNRTVVVEYDYPGERLGYMTSSTSVVEE